jgi:hypothetical protein
MTTISLPLFLVILAHSQNPQGTFTFTDLCIRVIKVEAYRAPSCPTLNYNFKYFGHIWGHCSSLQYVSGADATKNTLRKTQVPAHRIAATVSRNIP